MSFVIRIYLPSDYLMVLQTIPLAYSDNAIDEAQRPKF